MRSFWSDPYLWIHLSGLAALPILLELCLLGLAVGDPLLPPWLELFLVALLGIAPVLLMQWQRPFYIYSLVALTLKPEQLTTPQRTLLTLFRAQQGNRVPIILVPIVLVLILRQLYQVAPIAMGINPLPENARLLGLLVAALAFFGCNLFVQVPLSVVRVMLTSELKVAETEPYPVEKIPQDFTLIGLWLNQILPPIQGELSVASDGSIAQTVLPEEVSPTTIPGAFEVPEASPGGDPVDPVPDAPAGESTPGEPANS